MRPSRAVPIDDIAVERAVNGDPPDRLTQRELREAINRLDATGRYSSAEIAERVGCSTRAVDRARAARREHERNQDQ